MKNIKVITIIGVCFMFLLSCQNEEETIVNTDIFNYEGLKESVVEESITPISVTIDCGHDNRKVCCSENRDSLEFVMNNYDGCWYYDDPEWPACVRRDDPVTNTTHVTFYDLNPSTTYYYFVTEEGFYPEDPRKFSPIHSFKTDDLNLQVDMGGSVKWCGVNFLENRGAFNVSQFLSSSLFAKYDLPKTENETIEGNWRYPTTQELQELCDNCTVTMVDFRKEFVKITSKNGNSLYIPYTLGCPPLENKSHGWKHLMLFPSNESGYGLSVDTPDLEPLSEKWSYAFGCIVKFKNEVQRYNLRISTPGSGTDFYRWKYIDGTVTPDQEKTGSEKRGVRFVVEK